MTHLRGRAAVLESKLRMPRMPASAVRRGHLLGRMVSDADRGVVVTLVAAPAGAGKTMLLAQRAGHLRSMDMPVAWLSLDQNDNDSRTLWSGILSACARAVRGRHDRVAEALSALRPPGGTPDRGFLRAFFRAIDPLSQDLWLILDDIHEIVADAALDGVARLMTNVPPGLRLLLGSRYDPPLPLPQLLLDGTAAQLRAADLAFDRDEALSLVAGHGLQLSGHDLDVLLRRTEGWAAGLRLAAVTFERRDDPSRHIAAFAGDDQPVADYLVSEVLATQPGDTVDFLLATAIPERLTIDLANELASRRDAAVILDRLVRQNVLVAQPEVTTSTYRYHSLLRSYLIAELDRRDATAGVTIHRKASDWFDQHGVPEPALDHAVQAQAWERVASLLRRHGLRLLLEGDPTVARALNAAPRRVQAEPVVALIAAMAALVRGELNPAARRLDTLGRDPFAFDDARIRLLHTTALLYEARLRGDRSHDVDALVEATRVPAIDDHDLELLATAARGMTLIELGDFAEADSDLSAAFDLACRLGRDFLALECLGHLARSASAMSDFGEMVTRAERAIAFASERGWESSGPMVLTYVIAAWGAWQIMDTGSADRHLSRAAAIEADIEPAIRVSADVLRAHIDFTKSRDVARLRDRLRVVWADADMGHLTQKETISFILLELRTALSAGQGGWANELLDRAADVLDEAGDIYVLNAMARTYRGRNDAARKALAPIISAERPCQGVNGTITAWLLEAHLATKAGDPKGARQAVQRAIDLAAPHRTLRLVVETVSPSVRELLVADANSFGAHSGFVASVLGATDRVQPGHPTVLSGEALTARELELLRDLPSLMSLKDIAQARVVSVNTVKSHLQALYRKLDVTSRKDAVDRARELGLL